MARVGCTAHPLHCTAISNPPILEKLCLSPAKFDKYVIIWYPEM